MQLTTDDSLHSLSEAERVLSYPGTDIKYHNRDSSVGNSVYMREEGDSIVRNPDSIDKSKNYYSNVNRSNLAAYVYKTDNNGSIKQRGNYTRSFGDTKDEYVICEPNVTTIYHPIKIDGTPIKHTIISGSDGTFNAITTKQLSELLKTENSSDIFLKIYELVENSFGTVNNDNASIVVHKSTN